MYLQNRTDVKPWRRDRGELSLFSRGTWSQPELPTSPEGEFPYRLAHEADDGRDEQN